MNGAKLKFFLVALVSIASVSPLFLGVHAQQIQNPVAFENITEIINTYIPLLRLIFTVAFVGILMYGGFVYLTAGADDGKVATAKKIIIAAIVGFIIIVLAPAIVQFVGALLGVEGGLITNL